MHKSAKPIAWALGGLLSQLAYAGAGEGSGLTMALTAVPGGDRCRIERVMRVDQDRLGLYRISATVRATDNDSGRKTSLPTQAVFRGLGGTVTDRSTLLTGLRGDCRTVSLEIKLDECVAQSRQSTRCPVPTLTEVKGLAGVAVDGKRQGAAPRSGPQCGGVSASDVEAVTTLRITGAVPGTPGTCYFASESDATVKLSAYRHGTGKARFRQAESTLRSVGDIVSLDGWAQAFRSGNGGTLYAMLEDGTVIEAQAPTHALQSPDGLLPLVRDYAVALRTGRERALQEKIEALRER